MDATGIDRRSTARRCPSTGDAWFDHQWGDFIAVGGGGWDWFAVNLDDGTDLTLSLVRDRGRDLPARLRHAGRARRHDAAPAGEAFTVEPIDQWTSPRSGATYPSGWRIQVPDEALDLIVTPTVLDQELDTRTTTGVIYWEGSQTVRGDRRRRAGDGARLRRADGIRLGGDGRPLSGARSRRTLGVRARSGAGRADELRCVGLRQLQADARGKPPRRLVHGGDGRQRIEHVRRRAAVGTLVRQAGRETATGDRAHLIVDRRQGGPGLGGVLPGAQPGGGVAPDRGVDGQGPERRRDGGGLERLGRQGRPERRVRRHEPLVDGHGLAEGGDGCGRSGGSGSGWSGWIRHHRCEAGWGQCARARGG